MGLILIVSIVVSVLNSQYQFIKWPVNYSDTIGVSSQIITAIIALVVSVIGISVSLQNEECFGIKVSKLFLLRIELHYSFLQIILISIILCASNLLLYMCDLIIAAIGISLVSVIFCIYIAYTEIPLLMKEEKAILKLLRNCLLHNYKHKKEASVELKEAIKYLIISKNFNESFICLYHVSDSPDFKKHLLLKLLEYQTDIAFGLDDMPESEEKQRIANSLLNSIFDIVYSHLQIEESLLVHIKQNIHLTTRVIFRLLNYTYTQKDVAIRIAHLISYVGYKSSLKNEEKDFMSSIAIIIAAGAVKSENFLVLKEIRKHFSTLTYSLKDNSTSTTIFALLSMHLYYLCKSENDVPNELKIKISDFIIEDGIDEQTKIISWKDLFGYISDSFVVSLDEFVILFAKNITALEYNLFTNSAKWIFFDTGYAIDWFLSHLLNSHNLFRFEFSNLISNNTYKHRIKNFGEKCFNDDGEFTPTESMLETVKFYDDSSNAFQTISIIEKNEHRFFNLINELKRKDLDEDVAKASDLKNEELSLKLKAHIENKLSKEWHFDNSLEITNPSRAFCVCMEKFPEAINFDDMFFNMFSDGIFNDINKFVDCQKIYKDENFEQNISDLLLTQFSFATDWIKNGLQFFIVSEDVKKKIADSATLWESFSSNIINGEMLVTQNGFSFNCVLNNVEIRSLTKEELEKKVKNYQRADGQYVFEGVFLPQEEIIKIIQKKFMVVTVVFQHQVISSKKDVVEILPYFSKQDIEETE